MSYIGVGKDEFKIFQHYIYFSSDRAAQLLVRSSDSSSLFFFFNGKVVIFFSFVHENMFDTQ